MTDFELQALPHYEKLSSGYEKLYIKKPLEYLEREQKKVSKEITKKPSILNRVQLNVLDRLISYKMQEQWTNGNP